MNQWIYFKKKVPSQKSLASHRSHGYSSKASVIFINEKNVSNKQKYNRITGNTNWNKDFKISPKNDSTISNLLISMCLHHQCQNFAILLVIDYQIVNDYREGMMDDCYPL